MPVLTAKQRSWPECREPYRPRPPPGGDPIRHQTFAMPFLTESGDAEHASVSIC